MEIIRHHHLQGDILQRSVVKENHLTFRRISRFVKPDGELCEERPESPVWQEKIHSGEFHTVMDPARVAALEKAFVEQVILDSLER